MNTSNNKKILKKIDEINKSLLVFSFLLSVSLEKVPILIPSSSSIFCLVYFGLLFLFHTGIQFLFSFFFLFSSYETLFHQIKSILDVSVCLTSSNCSERCLTKQGRKLCKQQAGKEKNGSFKRQMHRIPSTFS